MGRTLSSEEILRRLKGGRARQYAGRRKKPEEWWDKTYASTLGASEFGKYYFGETPEIQEAWGTSYLKEGTEMPAELEAYLRYERDPYAVLGMWQGTPWQEPRQWFGQKPYTPSDQEVALRMMFARGRFSEYLDYLKEERTKGPAPKMGTEEWYKKETKDLGKILSIQGYGPTVDYIKEQMPSTEDFPWYHKLISTAGKGLGYLQRPMSAVLGYKTAAEKEAEEGGGGGWWDWVKGAIHTLLDPIPGVGQLTQALVPAGESIAKQLSPSTPEGQRPWTEAWRGLTGAEEYTGSRYLSETRPYMRGEGSIKYLRGPLGFAYEMVYDPLSYASMGGYTSLGKGAKIAQESAEAAALYGVKSAAGEISEDVLRKALQTTTKKSATRLAKKGAKRLTSYAAKHPDDIGATRLLKNIQEEGFEYLTRNLAPTAKLRGLVGQTRHLGMVGVPAAAIGNVGDVLRASGVAKALRPIFNAPGKVLNWLGTPLEQYAGRYRNILTRARSSRQWADALLTKRLKMLRKGLTPDVAALARDVPEIVSTELAESPMFLRALVAELPKEQALDATAYQKAFRKAIAQGDEAGEKQISAALRKAEKEFSKHQKKALVSVVEDVQSVARTLGQDSPFLRALIGQQPTGLEQTAELWGARGLHKGETGILKKVGKKEARKISEVTQFLRELGEPELQAGLLEGLNPAYMPHFVKGTKPAGLAPKEYSEYLASGLKRSGKKTIRELDEAKRALMAKGDIAAAKQLPDVETDLMRILERRGRASIRARINDDMQRQVGDMINEITNLPGATADEWKKINVGTGRLQGTMAPAELADEVSKFSKAIYDPQASNAIWRAFDKAQSVWKLWATSLRPGFHLRNHYSNLWLRYLADPAAVNPYWTVRAAKMEFKRQAGMQLDNSRKFLKLPGGQTLTEAQTMDLLQKLDIAHPGGLGGFDEPMRGFQRSWEGEVVEKAGALQSAGRAVSRYAPLPVTQRNIWGQGARRIGEAVENTDRIALFMQQLSKTGNFQHAASMVKRYLLDYGELSDVEQMWMRRIFPFYSWMRKATPLMMKEFLKKPGKFTTIPKAIRGVRVAATGEPDIPEGAAEYMPDYMAELGAEYVGIPGYEWVNPNFPQQELGKLMTLGEFPGLGRIPGAKNIPLPLPRTFNFGGKGAPSLMEGLSPFAKTPIEYATNYNLYLGRPIETFEGEWTQAPGWTTLPGLKQVLSGTFVKTPSGRMPKEMPPGVYFEEGPEGEAVATTGEAPEAFADKYMMRGKTAYFLNQLPFVTEIGKVLGQQYGPEETEKKVSRALSTFAGIKPFTYDYKKESLKYHRKLYDQTEKVYRQLLQTGLIHKPAEEKGPYPPDLYQFPSEIAWRQQAMMQAGIPLAKQRDIEGTIQNVLPNLPDTKADRMDWYEYMGYEPEFIDIVEKLYKQFRKAKSELRVPEIKPIYSTGYR